MYQNRTVQRVTIQKNKNMWMCERTLIELTNTHLKIILFTHNVKKAYNTVNQPLCIRKFSNFPICNQTLHWFTDSQHLRLYVKIDRFVNW